MPVSKLKCCFQIALLGSFTWSSDSKKIAYIAEAKSLAKEKCFLNAKIGGGEIKDALNEENYEQV